MKLLGLAPCGIVGAVAVLLGLYNAPEEGLSIRLLHPRSSQLMEKIESGQSVVPPSYEVREVDDTAKDPEDRVLVSRNVELSKDDFTGVELAPGKNGQAIYLKLSDEGTAELYDLDEDYPNSQMVIVTEDGEVMPVQRVRTRSKEGRLAIFLDPKIKKAAAQQFAAELSKDI